LSKSQASETERTASKNSRRTSTKSQYKSQSESISQKPRQNVNAQINDSQNDAAAKKEKTEGAATATVEFDIKVSLAEPTPPSNDDTIVTARDSAVTNAHFHRDGLSNSIFWCWCRDSS